MFISNCICRHSLKYSREEAEEASLSAPVEQFTAGEIGLIIGHPESWLTDTAKKITGALKDEGKLVFSFVDEYQMNLSSHWGNADFRFTKISN